MVREQKYFSTPALIGTCSNCSRPVLHPVERETEVTLRFPEVEKLSPPILMLSGVEFKYAKTGRTIFSNVDLSATMESRICIVS